MNQLNNLKYKNINIDSLFIIFSVILLGAFSLYGQIFHHFALDLKITVERHQKWMAGDSEFFNPWQYRVLSQWTYEGFIILMKKLQLSNPEIIAGIAFRYLQNLIIFSLFILYMRRLALTNLFVNILGLVLISYAFASSSFMSDLSFNLYTDIIFYLLGMIAILDKRYWLLLVCIGLGALNRETIGLLPVLALLFSVEKISLKLKIQDWKLVYSAIAGFILFGIIYFALRYHFGTKTYESIQGLNGPLDYFKYNLTFFTLYFQLLGTLSIFPFLTILFYKKMRRDLQLLFIGIVPLWFAIHLFMSLAVETRLFLVPAVMVFIPGFLSILDNFYRKTEVK